MLTRANDGLQLFTNQTQIYSLYDCSFAWFSLTEAEIKCKNYMKNVINLSFEKLQMTIKHK